MQPYDVVSEFESRVATYAGASHGVAVNSCTSALTLAVKYAFMQKGCEGRVWLPKRTYIGVPYAVLAAGGKPVFRDHEWQGAYALGIHRVVDTLALTVVDSARRFTSGMYNPGTLWCLSFHETKVLNIGDGGMILTDDWEAAHFLRQMRFDGRSPGKSVAEDTFTVPWALHCHMKPDVATRGLMLMAGVKEHNDDLPNDDYPDLSQMEVFK